MKVSYVLFAGIGIFLLVVSAAYGIVTELGELAGFPLLLLTSGLGFMIWYYLWATERSRDEVMDGDNPEGEIADLRGNYGDFYPWSWWPIGLAFGLAFVAFGLAIDWWVLYLAVLPVAFFITGWALEGSRKTYAH